MVHPRSPGTRRRPPRTTRSLRCRRCSSARPTVLGWSCRHSSRSSSASSSTAASAVLAMIVLAYGVAPPSAPSAGVAGRRRRSVDFDAVDDVASSITADAAAQRAALLHGAPRNAIVECWLRLEAAVVEAGVHRDPADTSAELTERVLASHHVDPAALAHLAALYREARFSDHPMDEDDRAGGDRRTRRRPRRARAQISASSRRPHEIVEATGGRHRRNHDRCQRPHDRRRHGA